MTPEDMKRETDILTTTEHFKAKLKEYSDAFLSHKINAEAFAKAVGSLARTTEIILGYQKEKGKTR